MGHEVLATLIVRHDYVGNAPAPVRIAPDTATARLAHRAGLILRAQGGRFVILAPDDRETLASFAENGALPIVLRVFAEDPALLSVTDALADDRGKVFVLDPGQVQPGPLHEHPALMADDLRELKPDDLITGADTRRPPLAIIHLQLAPDAMDAAYSVRFGALARYWTYHVMGGGDDASYSIRDTEGQINFDVLGPRPMADGRKAASFRSSEPIAYRARPKARFELLGDGPFGLRVVLPALPAAAPGSARLDPDGPGPGADIYVNVT